jgi:hypothetical protein
VPLITKAPVLLSDLAIITYEDDEEYPESIVKVDKIPPLTK